jgi:hypothetical protein
MEFSQDNQLIVEAASAKKGGGVNAVLGLLQEMISFQEKVANAADAQDLAENKQKLEEFQSNLGQMYESLLEMARGGVRSMRQEPEQEGSPVMMGDNSIQQIP